jgi:hypothetical protein
LNAKLDLDDETGCHSLAASITRKKALCQQNSKRLQTNRLQAKPRKTAEHVLQNT